MFVGRYNHFKCDDCGRESVVYNFPEGWVTTRKRGGGIPHHCEECVKKLPKGTRIWPAGAKESEYGIIR